MSTFMLDIIHEKLFSRTQDHVRPRTQRDADTSARQSGIQRMLNDSCPLRFAQTSLLIRPRSRGTRRNNYKAGLIMLSSAHSLWISLDLGAMKIHLSCGRVC